MSFLAKRKRHSPSRAVKDYMKPEVGGDEISEDGPKTEDDHHLHPKPKPKITEDRRPAISAY